MCANSGDPRSCDRQFTHKKEEKNGNFWVENLLIHLQLKDHLTCKAKVWAQQGLMGTEFKVLRHMTELLPAENRQKWTNLNQYFLQVPIVMKNYL